MFSFLNHIPQVTKNILILNIMFFVLTFFFEKQGIYLIELLGAHYVNSPLFEPYQIITHFFMHAGIFHIFFNMWLFVMLGSFLERLWGPKRFFIFYLVSALGAFALYNMIGFYEIFQLKQHLLSSIDVDALDQIIKTSTTDNQINQGISELLSNVNPEKIDGQAINRYINLSMTPMVGASGAVFGILAAFAILFPNTEFLIYFTFPVKAKFLVGAYFLWELYLSFNGSPEDNVAHLAHVGGAIVGGVLVLIWRKTDKKHFW